VTSLPFPPEIVVCYVSFISVKTALPPLLRLAAPGWQALVLVKPQFEAGRAEASKGKGVIRDAAVRARVVEEVAGAFADRGAAIMGTVESPITGADGNVELLLHARAGGA
jgi:23S rRNA (cytidine1920-2'-O)/16S rRNA (cytidine1409-2'-O)-methyltransferase